MFDDVAAKAPKALPSAQIMFMLFPQQYIMGLMA